MSAGKVCGLPWWEKQPEPISYQKFMGYCLKPKGHRGKCGPAAQAKTKHGER